MKISITKNKILNWILKFIIIALLWVLIWQAVYFFVNNDLFVPSPKAVAVRIFELASESDFWISVGYSIWRILIGFLLGVFIGVLFAFVSAISFFDSFFEPVKVVLRATPIASFIMLAWIWIKRDSIPVFISAIMVIPFVWGNLSTGIKSIDKDFKELATIYHLGFIKRIKYIYAPGILPYFATAICTCAGLVWKAGVAAEVLCLPKNSIGANLFYAKSVLDTLDVFSWTVVTVLISVFLELLIKFFLKKLEKRFAFEGLT